MNYRLPVLLSLFVMAAGPAAAQTFPVSGRVLDAQDQSPLPGATVVLTRLAADSARTGLAIDATGRFALPPVASGPYRLAVSFVGYQTLVRAITISRAPLQLGTLSLQISGVVLKGVEITGRAAVAVQKGDTVQYNAQALKTNPDASAQDLLTKMPGILVDPSTGKLQAQGEQVRRVLVDGKEYFGTDPDAVLKNLPAEAIDQIQVYDRASDQAQFTGFDDGNQQKAINIITKPRFRNGEFGRVAAGEGRGENQTRYRAAGTVNSFHGKQRLALIAQTNNVNEQNFGTDEGKSAGGGGSAGSGLSTTAAVGLNYSNVWHKKTDVQASYFFSRVGNTLSRQTDRRFTAPDSLGRILRYSETSLAGSTNVTNRFNLRLEHKFDSANSVLWQPRLSVQHTTSHNHLSGATYRGQPASEASGEMRSANLSDYHADNLAWVSRLANSCCTGTVFASAAAPSR